MVRVGLLFFFFLFQMKASAFALLRDELAAQPDLSDRFLDADNSHFGIHALATLGLDSIISKTNDQSARRSFSVVGFESRANWRLGNKLKFNFGVQGARSDAESDFLEDSSWSRSEVQSEVFSDFIARFELGDGLSVGGGVNVVHLPDSADNFELADLTAQVDSDRTTIVATEVVFIKVSSAWSAGLAWRGKKSAARAVRRSAANEVSEFTEAVNLDEQISAGLTAQALGSRKISLNVRTSASQSQFTTDTDSSAGASEEEQRRYEVSGLYSLDVSGFSDLSVGVGYRSIGYATQSNVSPQSIPLWTLLVRNKMKVLSTTTQIDATVGFGEDMQSLPDFNANYRRILVSLQAGVIF